MSQVRQFIDQIAAGQSADAKESLENILSGKAFESLDLYKKEIASSIFGGIEEEKECDTEKEDDEDDEDEKEEDDDEKEDKMKKEEFDQLDEVSKDTLKSYVKKASVDAGTNQLKMVRKNKNDTMKVGAPKEGPDYRNIGKQRSAGISKALDKLSK